MVGGPWMGAVLVAALGLGVAPVVMVGLGAFRVRSPAALWVGVGSVPLLVGAIGSFLGAGSALATVATGPRESAEALAASGLEVAAYPVAFGALCTGVAYLLMAMAGALGTLLGTARGGIWTPGHAVLTVPAAAIGIIALVGGSLAGTALAVLGALALGLVSVRFPSPSPGRDGPRAATSRVFTGVLVTLAATSVAALGPWSGPLWTHAVVASGLMLATAWSTLAVVVHLKGGRTRLSALLALLVLLPTFGMVAGTSARLLALAERAKPFGIIRAAEVAAAGIELPTVDGAGGPLLRASVLQFTPEGTWLDGVRMSPASVRAPDHVAIEADASTPLAAIRPYGIVLLGAALQWEVGADGLRSVAVAVSRGPEITAAAAARRDQHWPGEQDSALALLPHDRSWYLLRRGSGNLFESIADHKGLGSALLRARDEGHRDLDVWMPANASVQDLMDVVSATKDSDGDIMGIVWRLDPPPPAPDEDGTKTSGPSTSLVGSVNERLVREVVAQNMDRVRDCYERELALDPTLSGNMDVSFAVDGDGSVTSVYAENSTIGNVALESCVLTRFQQMVFPQTGGGIATVRYPLSFRVHR